MWADVGFNGEEGYQKLRVWMPSLPREGDRFEFYGPDGAAANVPAVLEMDKWCVAEVRWVMHDNVAAPTILLIRLSELESDDQETK